MQQSKVVNYQLGNGEEEERIVINRDTVDVEVYAGGKVVVFWFRDNEALLATVRLSSSLLIALSVAAMLIVL